MDSTTGGIHDRMTGSLEPAVSTSSKFWRGRAVFVTGATGLLGYWIVPELLRRGARVVALVRDPAHTTRPGYEWLDRVECVHGSLPEADFAGILNGYGIDTVIHLGAQTQVEVANADPADTLDVNVRGTWLLLEAVRITHTPRIIVASSDRAYGDSPQLTRNEDTPLAGRYPYDVSKSCADLVTTMYARTFGVQAAIARCSNVFGGGDFNLSRLIPGVIDAVLREENFRFRSNGESVRDFLYVEDAVYACLCLAERLAADSSLAGEAFNFSLGTPVTMLDLAHRVITMMGRPDMRLIVDNTARSETQQPRLDTSKATEVLAWSPRFDLNEGLRRTIDWYTRAWASQPVAAKA